MNTAETRQRWVILGISYSFLLSFTITLQAVPPVLSLIMSDLQLTHTQGGLLMSLFALPGIIISIPAGMLVDRYGHKLIATGSFILAISGTVILASGISFPIVALGRIISGIGAVTLSLLAPQILTQWFKGRELGLVMGLFSTGLPLGTIISLNFLSQIGEAIGWRISLWLSAGLPAVALIIFLILFVPAPRTGGQAPSKNKNFFKNIRDTGILIWLIGAGWMMFNASMMSMFTFTPDFLVANGFSVAKAGFITGSSMWPPLLLSPIVGFVIHKVGLKRTIITIGGLALTVCMALMPSSIGWIMPLVMLIGVSQTLVPPPTFSLIPEVVSPQRLGLGYGILITCQNLGILIGPASVGLITDVAGSYQASYALMAGFALLIAISMALLSWQQKAKFDHPIHEG